ncbi:unnamed protein product, partial [Nesidiocoris tenuis]
MEKKAKGGLDGSKRFAISRTPIVETYDLLLLNILASEETMLSILRPVHPPVVCILGSNTTSSGPKRPPPPPPPHRTLSDIFSL